MGPTMLHLIFPILISVIGVIILFRTIKKQRRVSYRDRKQQKIQSMSAAKTAFSSRETDRLSKLGLESLTPNLDDTFEPSLHEQQPARIQPSDTSEQPEPPAVIAFTIMAKKGKQFMGYELLQAILANGFRFGEMNIFHRHEKANGRGRILFSLTSAVEPGTFDMNAMGNYRCPGLMLFMQTADLKQATAIFDLMLTTAQGLADDLNGIVLDDKRQPLQNDHLSLLRHSLQFLPQNVGQVELDVLLDN